MIRALVLLTLAWTLLQGQITYKVQTIRAGQSEVLSLEAEQYVQAVLAGESSTFKSDEALKAMAIAARSYAARMKGRHTAEGFDFCSTTHCQRVDIAGISPRLEQASLATAGQILWYEGIPALSVYGRECGGKSEDAAAMGTDIRAPYLRVHEDPYCMRHGAAQWNWTGKLDDIAGALRRENLKCPAPLFSVTIATRTASGRAKVLSLENGAAHEMVSATSFRFALGRTLGWNGVRSDRYEITQRGTTLRIQGSGQGHGVGLCQKGAEQMGAEGMSFGQILAFYYPGTEIGFTARGLRWKRLGGEGVTLFVTNPDREGNMVGLAESVKQAAESRFRQALPENITVRVYPSLEVFRNATGEPGWIAARSFESTIDLQPAELLRRRGVLRSTLYHEFLHLAVEDKARPDLPIWFREGLVECLSGTDKSTRSNLWPNFPEDDPLRQRTDEVSARKGYRDAQKRVAELLARYGEGTVLGWLRTGIPPAVINSTASKEPTNRR